jgi:26S proteasome regulatory subunit T6
MTSTEMNQSENKTDGIKEYYMTKIQQLEIKIREKQLNFMRLKAQRNDINDHVIDLKEELRHLLKPANSLAEVVKILGEDAVLVKTSSDTKLIVKINKAIKLDELKVGARVTLKSEEKLKINRIIPSKVDPLVSLMKVEKVPDSTYDMVGGLDEQIKEIREVIELPIKHPEIFDSLGIAQPKGVIMYGPPGTGKTLLARAVAHHTDCTFIRVSGNELVQKYIGEGARMVRELFVMARQHAPSIIFMDEIDSIGGARIEDGQKGDSEVQRTMLELLNQLDGFESTNDIKIIMATNRIDILDDALLRPGRIDRKIEFPHPNEKSRVDILKIHSKKMNLMRGINLQKIAVNMSNASGAECKGACSEAGMFALRERRMHVTQEDFEMAVAKVMKKDDNMNLAIKKIWK